MLSDEGFTVVTGGGIGVSESVSKGAKENNGQAIGIAMEMDGKAQLNKYLTRSLVTHFPFTRKLLVTAPSKGFVFFPGRMGTLHQLFEVLALVQTHKMSKLPILLYDSKFWQPLDTFIKEVLVEKFGTIASEDEELYKIVDDEEEIVQILRDFRSKEIII
jgi:hypothetical protein